MTAWNPAEPVDGGFRWLCRHPVGRGASGRRLSTSFGHNRGRGEAVGDRDGEQRRRQLPGDGLHRQRIRDVLALEHGQCDLDRRHARGDDPVPGALATATATLSDGSMVDITNMASWASSSSSVTVSALGIGVATGVSIGSAKITAALAATSPAATIHVVAPPRVLVVNTTLDLSDQSTLFAGLLSLREAIDVADAVAGETITFDPTVFETPQTIYLSGKGPLDLSDTSGKTTIMGPGGGLVTVSGGHVSGVFQIDAG